MHRINGYHDGSEKKWRKISAAKNSKIKYISGGMKERRQTKAYQRQNQKKAYQHLAGRRNGAACRQQAAVKMWHGMASKKKKWQRHQAKSSRLFAVLYYQYVVRVCSVAFMLDIFWRMTMTHLVNRIGNGASNSSVAKMA